MRRISFSLTSPQLLNGSKDVTRRLGWDGLKGGDILCAIEKGMGLKEGEQQNVLALILVVSARSERLDRMVTDPVYGLDECRREGFPAMTPREFVEFFCASHTGCFPGRPVTRIEFRKLPNVRETFALHLRGQHGSTYGHNLVDAGGEVIGARSSFTPKVRYAQKHPARTVYTMTATGEEFDTAAEFLVAYQTKIEKDGATG